jgi:superoxide dismutase, Cu-Zn family
MTGGVGAMGVTCRAVIAADPFPRLENRMRPLIPVPAIALLLSACAAAPTTAPRDAGTAAMTPAQAVAAASSNLSSASGSLVSGRLTLLQARNGVRVTGEIGGLEPGSSHGFHVHERGDCSAADASSAGGHFNPAGSAHGNPESHVHHAGDIDNIVADADGVAHVDARIPGTSLSNAADGILGRALVVHAAPDDYRTQPSGNSGARIACGVIRPGR